MLGKYLLREREAKLGTNQKVADLKAQTHLQGRAKKNEEIEEEKSEDEAIEIETEEEPEDDIEDDDHEEFDHQQGPSEGRARRTKERIESERSQDEEDGEEEDEDSQEEESEGRPLIVDEEDPQELKRRLEKTMQAQNEHVKTIKESTTKTSLKVSKTSKVVTNQSKKLKTAIICTDEKEKLFKKVKKMGKKAVKDKEKKKEVDEHVKKYEVLKKNTTHSLIGSLNDNKKVTENLQKIKDYSQEARMKSRETMRRLGQKDELREKLIKKAKQLNVSMKSVKAEENVTYPGKRLDASYPSFRDFVSNQVLDYAFIINKAPYLCDPCNSIAFSKRAEMNIKAKQYDMSFMVDLQNQFEYQDSQYTEQRSKEEFYKSLKLATREQITSRLWPRILLPADEGGRLVHECVRDKDIVKEKKLTDYEIEKEHERILKEVKVKPCKFKLNNLTEIYDDEGDSEEESLSADKRDPTDFKSRSASPEPQVRIAKVGDQHSMTIPKEKLKLYETLEVVYTDKNRSKVPVDLKGCEKVVFWYKEEKRKGFRK